MNRPIKFRVWTGISMEYNVVVGKDGAFYALIDRNDSACLAPTSKYHSDTPVMQYTGLKDKNGKEIYEGDVLERNTSYYYKVEYCEKNAAYICRNCDGCFVYLSDFEYIIIGNLMEHPELLK